MRRGTTPTVTLRIDRDLSGSEVHVTFRQGERVITKREGDIEAEFVEGTTTLRVPLTQAETLSFASGRGSLVEVQVRYKRQGRACATEIARMPVEDILLEGAI